MATPKWLDPEHYQSNDGLLFAQESWLAWTRVPLTVVSELRLTLSELLRVAEAHPANADTDWWADCKSLLEKSESLCQAADVSPPIVIDASPQTAAGEYRQRVWFRNALQGYSSAWWHVDLCEVKILGFPKYFTSRQVMREQCVDCLKTWLAVLDDVIAAASPSDETPDVGPELQAGPAAKPQDVAAGGVDDGRDTAGSQRRAENPAPASVGGVSSDAASPAFHREAQGRPDLMKGRMVSHKELVDTLWHIRMNCATLGLLFHPDFPSNCGPNFLLPQDPDGFTVKHLRLFWQRYADVQSQLDGIPADALDDLSSLTGKPWDLITRRTLDFIAHKLKYTQLSDWDCPDWERELTADERSRMLKHSKRIRSQLQTWNTLLSQLEQQTLELNVIRGRKYPGWNDGDGQGAERGSDTTPPELAAGGDDDDQEAAGGPQVDAAQLPALQAKEWPKDPTAELLASYALLVDAFQPARKIVQTFYDVYSFTNPQRTGWKSNRVPFHKAAPILLDESARLMNLVTADYVSRILKGLPHFMQVHKGELWAGPAISRLHEVGVRINNAVRLDLDIEDFNTVDAFKDFEPVYYQVDGILRTLRANYRFQPRADIETAPALAGGVDDGKDVAGAGKSKPGTKSKKSTVKGEARAKLIAALSLHHKYQEGSCLNTEPIGCNELARQAQVSQGSATPFFKAEFKGYSAYKVVCRDPGRLAESLKVLNGEFSPQELYGRNPPGESADDGDE